MKILNSVDGFTLIEILVTISLGLIVTVSGMAYYSNFNRRQMVEQSAKKIVSDLRLAQNLALTQEKPDQESCACDFLNGYSVNFNFPEKSYQIAVDCNPACEESVIFKEAVLENVTLSGLQSVKFLVLTQGVQTSGGDTLTISSDNFSYSKEVVIGGAGNIKIN